MLERILNKKILVAVAQNYISLFDLPGQNAYPPHLQTLIHWDTQKQYLIFFSLLGSRNDGVDPAGVFATYKITSPYLYVGSNGTIPDSGTPLPPFDIQQVLVDKQSGYHADDKVMFGYMKDVVPDNKTFAWRWKSMSGKFNIANLDWLAYQIEGQWFGYNYVTSAITSRRKMITVALGPGNVESEDVDNDGFQPVASQYFEKLGVEFTPRTWYWDIANPAGWNWIGQDYSGKLPMMQP